MQPPGDIAKRAAFLASVSRELFFYDTLAVEACKDAHKM
jgi:hypothetical protein